MGLGSSPLVRVLPLLGLASWAGAILWASKVLDPWGPFGGPYQFFGLATPTAVPLALAIAATVAALAAAWFDGWAWPYLPAGLVLLLGCGARIVPTATAILDLTVFAGLVLLATELASAKGRFNAVIASGRGLSRQERAPLLQFLVRYLVGVVLLCSAYAALAWLLATQVVPAVAGLFSARLADSVELRSSVGLVLFSGALLGAVVLVRMVVDGIRPAPPPAIATTDIRELRPLTREESA